jgi:CubicO group peptidase (beta-lactamase class C family)
MPAAVGAVVDSADLGEATMTNCPSLATRRTFAIIGFAISLLATSFATAEWDHLPSEVESGMEMWQVPGMAVAVVNGDSIEFQQGFGSTAIADGSPVDEHTMFAIASTTKAMVVTGILMLADEEKLSLDDLIVTHIPELHFANPALDQELTIRDMFAHRTGLPSTDYWAFLQAMDLDEQIRRLRLVDTIAPARTRLIYQNTMYELAGEIIERVSGIPWDRFLTERLWQPIGMDETVATRGRIADGSSQVLPYQVVQEKLVQADWDLYEDHADAAGSVWSSIHDMSLWAQFLLRGGITAGGQRLVSEASLAQMFEPHQLSSEDDFYPTTTLTQPHWRSYGLGWFQQDFQGRMINFHTGSLSGLVAIIGLDRAADKAVIVLANRDHAEVRHALLWSVMDTRPQDDRRDWNQDVFDRYEGLREEALAKEKDLEASRLRGTKPALALKSYVGTYSNDIVGEIEIGLDGRTLTAAFPTVSWQMKHWHVETFQLLDAHGESVDFLSFTIDPDGAVASLNVIGHDFVRKSED